MIDEVLALALKPFLARCAEVWGPRVADEGLAARMVSALRPLSRFRDDRGRRPLSRSAADARCSGRTDLDRCVFCAHDAIRSFTSAGWTLSRARLQSLPEVPEGVRRAGRAAAGADRRWIRSRHCRSTPRRFSRDTMGRGPETESYSASRSYSGRVVSAVARSRRIRRRTRRWQVIEAAPRRPPAPAP